MSEMPFLATLGEKVAPGNAALLVIDVQNDFCDPKGAFGRSHSDLSMVSGMMRGLQSLITGARKVGVPVIFIKSVYDPIHLFPAWYERNARIDFKVPRCESGTWGCELYQLSPLDNEVVIEKHRYSAFVGTDLDLILRSNHIQTTIVAGIATNICVESTARDAFMRNYYVVAAADAAAAYGSDQHAAALRSIEVAFGVTASSDDILQSWNSLRTAA